MSLIGLSNLSNLSRTCSPYCNTPLHSSYYKSDLTFLALLLLYQVTEDFDYHQEKGYPFVEIIQLSCEHVEFLNRFGHIMVVSFNMKCSQSNHNFILYELVWSRPLALFCNSVKLQVHCHKRYLIRIKMV